MLLHFKICDFLLAKRDDTISEKRELDKRKNSGKVKIESGSLKDKIFFFREPHKKDQKETENSETTKKGQIKEESEMKEEKAEADNNLEKSDHAKKGN